MDRANGALQARPRAKLLSVAAGWILLGCRDRQDLDPLELGFARHLTSREGGETRTENKKTRAVMDFAPELQGHFSCSSVALYMSILEITGAIHFQIF